MGKRIKVKPGKSQSMMGFFIGIVFCGIGLFVAIPTFGAFGVFWTIIAVIITVTNGINAFSAKGIPTHSIEIEDTEEMPSNKEVTYTSGTIEERLEKLKSLYEQQLITQSEYEQKKRELLKQL